jgi:hypothetical protein
MAMAPLADRRVKDLAACVISHEDQFVVGIQQAIFQEDVVASTIPLVDLQGDLYRIKAMIGVNEQLVQGSA